MSGSDDASQSLTGVWHGLYSYPVAWMPPAHFTATMIDSGGVLSGTTHEETGRGVMRALVEGSLEGGVVRFVKVYSPASEEFQDVIYTGTLSADRTEIEGEWTVPDVWSGTFLMIRTRGKAQVQERRVELSV
ncbi:MAG: hypothetical protein LCH61_17890 [Proteobacteria bacterium]|nr:hypothetical protein [Pseudomonadota bacterium]